MRPYLEGYHFIVYPDHQSLRWLRNLMNPTGRLARWTVYLQQYDFDIKYRKGVLNRVADTLSREPQEDSTEEIEALLLAVEEGNICSWYRRRRKYTEVEENPDSHAEYCIRNGKLFRHFFESSDSTDSDLTDPCKLVVPKPLRKQVMEENHDRPTAGHLGIAKTAVQIAQKYYWSGMFRDIAKYVRSCSSCQRHKISQQKPPGMMQPTHVTMPWETVSTDLVGPLPRSSKGNCYMVVFQDGFSKWVQCRPLPESYGQGSYPSPL